MAGKKSRELEIRAVMKDFISGDMKRIARTMNRLVKTGMLAPFKLLGKALRSVKNAVVGIAGVLGGLFLVWRSGGWAAQVVDTADALNKLAQETNTSVESISVLEKAFQFAGLSVEQFRAIVTGLGRGINAALSARGRGSMQGDAFAQLGLSLQELKDLDAVQIFQRMAEGLERFDNVREKQEVLGKIFPDNFGKLIPLLGDLEKGFLANVSAAEAFGAGLSKGLADAASETATELLRLKIALENIGRKGVLSFFKDFEPALQGIVEFLRINKDGLADALAAALQLLADVIFKIAKVMVWLAANLPAVRLGFRSWLEDVALIGPSLVKAFDALGGGDGADIHRQNLKEYADQWLRLQKILDEVDGGGVGDMLREMSGSNDAAKGVEILKNKVQGLKDEFESYAARHFGEEFADEEKQAAKYRATIGKLSEELQQLSGSGLGGFAGFGSGDKKSATGGKKKADGGDPVQLQSDYEDFFASFGEGMDGAVKDWTDFKQAGQEAGRALIDTIGNSLAQAFTDIIMGAKSAREAFRDMAVAILNELAKIISKLIVLKLVKSVTTYAEGGVSTGAVQQTYPVRAFAKGGVVESPTIALFGEAGSEAFVPLASGKIPVRIENSQPSIPEMNITIHAMDGADVKRVLVREKRLLKDLGIEAMRSSRDYQQAIGQAGRR